VQYYDHALVGATLALATGTQRRYGWAVVTMGAAAAALPDWDAVPYPAGTPGYPLVHRVWGHNLLVAPLLSGLVGAVGYLCWQSLRGRGPDPERAEGFSGPALAVWVAVGVLAALSHLLADVCYCGAAYTVDWPVALLWPFTRRGWGLPLVPWGDRSVTWILSLTLIAACLRPAAARLLAVFALLVVVGYALCRGLSAPPDLPRPPGERATAWRTGSVNCRVVPAAARPHPAAHAAGSPGQAADSACLGRNGRLA
jgi:membrane-bound metal-dependent hydrolase YbcI (DUF457 family)